MSGTLIAGAIVLGVIVMTAMAVAVAVRPNDHRRNEKDSALSASDFVKRDSPGQ